MNRRFAAAWLSIACGVGCQSSVPSKYSIVDLSSGEQFVTYDTWGAPHIAGYSFDDLLTGDRVTLTNFRIHMIDRGGSFKRNDPRVVEYEKDLDAVLMKKAPREPEPKKKPPARLPRY